MPGNGQHRVAHIGLALQAVGTAVVVNMNMGGLCRLRTQQGRQQQCRQQSQEAVAKDPSHRRANLRHGERRVQHLQALRAGIPCLQDSI